LEFLELIFFFEKNREQELSNYLYKKDYKNAILLCLELDQPRRLFKILSDVIETQMSGKNLKFFFSIYYFVKIQIQCFFRK